MAGNCLFGHQGLLARSRQIVVKHGSALPPKSARTAGAKDPAGKKVRLHTGEAPLVPTRT
jgi:hypothetical protein